MRKYLYAVLALAFAAAGCQKIEEIAEPGEVRQDILTATLNAETRTMLGEKGDGGYANLWSKGDEIGVFIDGKNEKNTFTLQDGAGNPKATFVGTGRGKEYVAVYPAVAAERIDGTKVFLNLPAEQTYAPSSFGPNSFPMVAVSNDTNLAFKNLSSLIRIPMTGSATILSITFKANNQQVFVAGPAVADLSQPAVPTLAMGSGAGNEVTLKCPEGVELTGDQAVDFYISVPAQVYTGGFTLTIRSSRGTMVKGTSSDVEMKRSEMRSAPIAFEVTEGIAPSETLSGEGTDSAPFQIRDICDLLLFQQAVNNAGTITSTESGKRAAVQAQTAYYQLEYDVDLSAVGQWTPIGTGSANPFKGIFNGGGHSITGLQIESTSDNVGLFGYCFEPTIKNLIVTGQVSGNSNVGIIAGSVSGGTFVNCESHGSVNGKTQYIGGIAGDFSLSLTSAGYIKKYGAIDDCSNHAEINGSFIVGGVVGHLYYATMNNCKNYGAVSSTAKNATGGVVGSVAYSSIYNCVNGGTVTGWKQLGGIAGLTQGTDQKSIANCHNVGEIVIQNYTNVDHIGGIVGDNAGCDIANCVNVGKFTGNVGSGSLVAFGSVAGINTRSISNCYGLSGCGASKVIGTDSGTSEGVYSLTEQQMSSTESSGYELYKDSKGTYYANLRDALNAWAADNSTSTLIYFGWDYSGSDHWPTLTRRPAVKPGSGSDEQFSHSFSVTHVNTNFALPVLTGSYMNATVDWGDGKTETYGTTQAHAYSSAGEHTVTIKADNATSFKLNNLVGVTGLNLN